MDAETVRLALTWASGEQGGAGWVSDHLSGLMARMSAWLRGWTPCVPRRLLAQPSLGSAVLGQQIP